MINEKRLKKELQKRFDDESEDWNYSKNCDELCGM